VVLGFDPSLSPSPVYWRVDTFSADIRSGLVSLKNAADWVVLVFFSIDLGGL